MLLLSFISSRSSFSLIKSNVVSKNTVTFKWRLIFPLSYEVKTIESRLSANYLQRSIWYHSFHFNNITYQTFHLTKGIYFIFLYWIRYRHASLSRLERPKRLRALVRSWWIIPQITICSAFKLHFNTPPIHKATDEISQ